MADQQALPAALQVWMEEVAEQARQLMYGPEGVPAWGTLFTEIEETGAQVGDALAQALMRQTVQKQADQRTAQLCRCGAALEDCNPEPRVLTTRRGAIGWNEPSGTCPRCRRAFFPSVPSVGAASG
jgi:hypothetical protein